MPLQGRFIRNSLSETGLWKIGDKDGRKIEDTREIDNERGGGISRKWTH